MSTHLSFIQQHASNTLPSPPSPSSFTFPSPAYSNRPNHPHNEYRPLCSIPSLELRPLMIPNITSVLSSSSNDCRLPSLQNMLALPPPSKDHPLNAVNNTHVNVAPFHHQQYTASHFAKRIRCNDNDDDDAVIVHHHQKHHGTVIQKKPKHRHHDDTRGLRHFSKQVCDTVAKKGITTYSEVAEELASSIRANGDNAGCTITSFDQKNIRRRVYDALNVLMGTGIIAKDKKNIKWVGDIACTDEHVARKMHDQHLVNLQAQIHREQVHQATLITSLDEMSHLIRDKLQQHVQLCHLVWKNQQRNEESTPPDHARVGLPFFLVSSLDGHDMQIQVQDDGRYAEISDIRIAHSEARIIYEDVDVLASLGLNNVTHEQLDAWLPHDPVLRDFVSMRHYTRNSSNGTIVC